MSDLFICDTHVVIKANMKNIGYMVSNTMSVDKLMECDKYSTVPVDIQIRYCSRKHANVAADAKTRIAS